MRKKGKFLTINEWARPDFRINFLIFEPGRVTPLCSVRDPFLIRESMKLMKNCDGPARIRTGDLLRTSP